MRRCARTLVVLGVVCAVMAAGGASAQQAQRGQPETQIERQPPGARPGDTAPPKNTTVVPRSAAETKATPSTGELTLVALLTDDGQRIDQGLIWRVFQEQPGAAEAKPKAIGNWRDASPQIRLPPGDYIVNASFGRAHLTRRIKVEVGAAQQERFVLNAGGLRVNALLSAGETAPERAVTYEIFTGESDQLGNRSRIMGNGRPGLIVRLNAGIYHLVSTYGDANAIVRADVTVEPGKLTEAMITHPGAKVTFKLVTRAGGEAQADTQWHVLNPQGDLIKESVGALPTHVLGPGAYVVNAKQGGRTFRRSFSIQSGDPVQIEVVMQ
jgi:hypothetical protein